MRSKTAILFVIAAVSMTPLGCSRNAIDAVNLANEGDAVRDSNVDDAISKYEQATTLDPTNHRILAKLARVYRKKEDWSKVALTCSKAEKLAPTFANYYLDHGYALEKMAEKGPTSWAEAKEPLTQAIAKDPGLSDAYEELANVQYHMDDEQGALQSYTKAIDTKSDQLGYYVPLAQLYNELGYADQAEQVVREGLTFAKEGDKALFNLHSMLGYIYENKKNVSGAIGEYEAAKKACGQCQEPGQQIAYFNLGAAYAQATPPRKNEGIQQLQSFSKIICRGAGAARYTDQCSQAQEIVKRLGGTMQ